MPIPLDEELLKANPKVDTALLAKAAEQLAELREAGVGRNPRYRVTDGHSAEATPSLPLGAKDEARD
jgi:hypothetical protein